MVNQIRIILTSQEYIDDKPLLLLRQEEFRRKGTQLLGIQLVELSVNGFDVNQHLVSCDVQRVIALRFLKNALG